MEKIAKIILICLFAAACCDNKKQKAYTICKSDDNNWTTSAVIQCDSFTMPNEREAIFYVNGKSSILRGKMIKAYSN